MTVSDLIARALRTIGVLAAGEAVPAADAQDGLAVLNAMIDGWRADRLTVDHLTRNEFSTVNGTASYTIGPTGTWVYPSVPTWIEAAGVILTGSDPAVEVPIEVLTPQRYEHLVVKSESFTPAYAIYYTRTSAATGTVHVFAVPDATQTIVLYLLSPLAEFTATTETVTLPSGYEDALVYNLAKRLCLEYGRPVDPTLAELASTTLGLLKSANVQPVELTTDRALWSVPRRGWSRSAFLRGY